MTVSASSLHPRATQLVDEFTAWRHHLHAHPETAFEEKLTSAFVAEKLQSFGLDVKTGIAKTGVVATLQGKGGPGKRIGLRADMDALDIHETTNLPYASKHPGKMHACGHDGHMTMLLGAAKILAENPDFTGTVDFIFQPAEENEGGGREMVEEGLFDSHPADAVYGMHNWPGRDVGTMAMKPGPMMASYDIFEIAIDGRGCHAAMPHLGRDPITAAGQVLLALQTITARNVNPLQSAVISPTQIFAGDTWNVIPDTATIRGTVRTFAPDIQDLVEERLKTVADATARAFDCTARVMYQRRYPATINSEGETAIAFAAASRVVGADQIDQNPEPSMASEDFAFMLNAKPGSYVWLGNGPTDGNCLLHNAAYDFNDDAIPYGVSYWISLVEECLSA
ncbi:M20 aminoacylase family protein [Thalassospira sp. MCCC 1A03138]|uniref:M20 aminoacylase family protein n=1 Tax=Thalassospira sp. MCCC 1A03138 TaxID=1470576 RepID=UPI000A1E3614|nr:M20 aminoacylase family protein [Thalassospira sp. MCCC 1A03138]OSQ29599.1 peptidase M20 [Thalassospira sp. MCCC 1A03138]